MLLVAGCQDDKAPASTEAEQATTAEGDDKSEGEGAAQAEPEKKPPTPYQVFVESFRPTLRDRVMGLIQATDFNAQLQKRITKAVRHEVKRQSAHPSKRKPMDLYYAEQIQDFFATREYKPAFTAKGHLTPAAHAAFDLMKVVEDHALDPADYRIGQLTTMVTDSDEMAAQLEKATGFELFDNEVEPLAVFLEAKAFDIKAEDAGDKLFELLLSEGDDNPLPRIGHALTLYRTRQAKLLKLSVELETLFADSYLRYTRDMSHANINRFTDAERKRYARRGQERLKMDEEVHPKKRNGIILNRLRLELDHWAAIKDADAAKAHVLSLWPPHPQYAKLIEGRKRYKAIVDKGGWKKVEKGKLNYGGSAPRVKELKERLAAEGLFEGNIDNNFDKDLQAAIRLYQETHQLDITGQIKNDHNGRVFWNSLNLAADRRLKQIEVNLKRWRRDSHMMPSDHYVYINVPDFTAEVWKGGDRKMRFRIIAGNRKQECDTRTGRKKYVNATPLQHAHLSRVIFNPFWNVPPRIEQEEYLPQIQENPNWLEENGFEYANTRDGSTVFRQKPGEGNALGRVKFIFPNKHNTYMHDTPKENWPLFTRPIRSYSHGCMRVEEPMDFAEYLMRDAGLWNKKEIDHIYETQKERGYSLPKPLDVFIEYTTTRVADDGHVHFLADVYRFVRQEIRPSQAARCNAGKEDKVVVKRPTLIRDADGKLRPEFSGGSNEPMAVPNTLLDRSLFGP